MKNKTLQLSLAETPETDIFLIGDKENLLLTNFVEIDFDSLPEREQEDSTMKSNFENGGKFFEADVEYHPKSAGMNMLDDEVEIWELGDIVSRLH